MNRKYPFDPSINHHFIIAFGLAIWIFVFLYFTEPLDVNQFTNSEKLLFLPLYGLLGAFCYLIFLPVQHFLYQKNNRDWFFKTEITFLIIFIFVGIVSARAFYLFVIVPDEPNPYTLSYHIKTIILPVFATILPIIIFGRFAFGKYKEKKLEHSKIEINGEGNYEGLRLLLNDIICIQSSDNYIEVFYFSGNELKKSLIRNKLSVIADEFPAFLRTHRSHLINPYHFLKWKSVKGKLFIVLFQEVEIPVSKTYQTDVKKKLNSATE